MSDALPSSPAAIPSDVASFDAVADERKRRTVAAIPEGTRFVTRDEVRAMLDAQPAPTMVLPPPAIHALRGIEAAARVDATMNVISVGLILVGAAVALWKLRD